MFLAGWKHMVNEQGNGNLNKLLDWYKDFFQNYVNFQSQRKSSLIKKQHKPSQ